MKKILVTGQNSYIGKSFISYMKKYKEEYSVDSISLKTNDWQKKDFTGYTTVLHLAAMVHFKEKNSEISKVYEINRDLTLKVANKAYDAGVKQFIFISTMAVYGLEGSMGKGTVITTTTPEHPKTAYAKSKLEAENLLKRFVEDRKFKLLIVRPPMVYGPECPGNYSSLNKFSKITPIFPLVENMRSVISIENLIQHLNKYIDEQREGIVFPQDDEYMNTSHIIKKLAKKNGKSIYLSKVLGTILVTFGKRIRIMNKIFGTLIYEKDNIEIPYKKKGERESISDTPF